MSHFSSILKLLIKNAIGRVIGRVLLTCMLTKLKKEINKCSSIKNYVDLSYNFHLRLKLPFIRNAFKISPIQVKEEIKQLLDLLVELRPRTLLEIGTANGGTLFLFSMISSHDATILSIDLPGGPFGGGYPSWRIPFYKAFAMDKQNIHLIRGNSHDYSTLNVVKEILSGQKLDFLFIDGDHTYEGVKKDFEMYSPLVRKGGIIAFHDIVPDYWTRYGIRTSSQTGCVLEFWKEIKPSYKSLKIIKDPNQDGYGIGVIYV